MIPNPVLYAAIVLAVLLMVLFALAFVKVWDRWLYRFGWSAAIVLSLLGVFAYLDNLKKWTWITASVLVGVCLIAMLVYWICVKMDLAVDGDS